jgi:hypothetical protein
MLFRLRHNPHAKENADDDESGQQQENNVSARRLVEKIFRAHRNYLSHNVWMIYWRWRPKMEGKTGLG